MKSRKLAAVLNLACRYGMEDLEKRVLLTVLPTGFTETTVASGLTSPTALVNTPDGRVFFSDQTGHIYVIQNNQMLPTPLADLSSEINSDGERGLLGITIDSQFETDHYIYLYYTANSPTLHNRVSRITENDDALNTMVPGSEKVLFDLPDIPNNNSILMGGSIQFGGDGKLYVAVGDQNDTTTSQSLTSDFGKILRINSDGTIPTDNPFYNQTTGVYRAIWAMGLRNPFTTAVQPGTGRFFIDDVGQEGFEEIDDGTAGGENFGWPTTEGTFDQASFPNFTEPFLSYAHGTLGTAITGGSFYDPANNQFPAQYVGQYFFNDFTSGTMYTIDPTTKAITTFETGLSFPEGINVGSDGSMYYLERGQAAGGQPGTDTGSVEKIQFVANTAPTIAQQPAPTLASVGFPATFTVSAAGTSPFTYQWQENNVDITGANSATYTLPAAALTDNNAQFRCHVSNAFGNLYSNAATLSVTSVPPPTPIILTPTNGMSYRDGDTINFSGMATDQLDGTEPNTRLTWRVDFQHEMHAHPFIPNTSGISGGSFVIPNTGETDPVQWYRIYLTATDSLGLTTTVYTEIFPIEANLTLGTTVPGASFTLDGQTATLPEVVKGVTREIREVNIPLIQLINGQYYEFTGWSDGGAEDHTLVFPDSDATLTANLTPVSQTFVSDMPFLGTPTNGFGPVERDTSNGQANAGDGTTITLNGVTYAKGLGAHADSDIKFNLGGAYDVFTSDVGIDDEEGTLGTVDFQVFGDGVKLFDSGVMTGASATQTAQVSVKGVQTLELVINDTGDGIDNDHGDWAGASVFKATAVTGPAAPSGLTAAVVSTGQVDLNWTDNSNNETGFKVERSTDGTNFTALPTLPPNTTSFNDTNLTPGKQYWYEIVSTNSSGDSTPSNVVTVTTFAATPTTTYVSSLPFANNPPPNGWGPVELNTSNGENNAGDGNVITLNGVTYAKGLGAHANSDIQYALGGNYTTFISDIGIDDEVTSPIGSVIFQVVGDGKTLYTSPVMTATSTTISLTINVTGVNTLDLIVTDAGDGNSFDHADWAGAALLSSSGVATAPQAPTNLTASAASTTSITLNWQDKSNNETGFKIERSLNGGAFTQIFVTAANATTYTDMNLPAGTYTYQVRATNATGDSGYTNVSTGVTLTAATSPAAPTTLLATAASTSSITLTWLDKSNNETGFKIERSLNGGAFAQIFVTAANATTYTDGGLAAGTYTYQVRATNATGDSAYTNTSTTATLPAAPTSLALSVVSSSSIKLTWVDNATNETGYLIERSTDGTTFTQLTPTQPMNTTTFTDTGLTAGMKYYYRVRATNAGGNSAYSSIQNATTTSVSVPTAPSNLALAVVSYTSITLTWKDNSTTETGYKIERSTDGTTFTQIKLTAANVVTFTDTGLTANTKYYYRVRATNAGGDSAYTSVVNATTLPGTFVQGDVGTVGAAGSVAVSSGVYTLKGAGTIIGGTSDSFHFVYETLNGDGTIICRLTAIQNTNSAAQEGIMIRETLNANSRFAMMDGTAANKLDFVTRATAGGSSTTTTTNGTDQPDWIKLVRSGNTLTGYRGTNGTTWTQLGPATTVTMASSVFIGLVVNSHTSGLNTSTMDNVSISGGAQTLALQAAQPAAAQPAASLFSTTKVTSNIVTLVM